MGAKKIEADVEEGGQGREKVGGYESEYRQQQGCLVEDTTIVWRDVVSIEEKTLLYWFKVNMRIHAIFREHIRLLKLVTGVDISTRPARRFGRAGKVKNRNKRRIVAEIYRRAFRLSMTISKTEKRATAYRRRQQGRTRVFVHNEVPVYSGASLSSHWTGLGGGPIGLKQG